MYKNTAPVLRNSRTEHGNYLRILAAYSRISQEDGADLESNSITNQREIIKNYIAGKEEFKGVTITDYVDDGISGSHSDREAYKRLMADIERGTVDCVIVKDLSRIGRNMIDVDDLLMNQLVTLNVRFIAINNGYDSFTSPLSNLELAIINLANQHYNRDLAEKSMSVKQNKARRGEYLAFAPFGYKKSKKEKNKLVPDDEVADYVRLIFSFACEGRNSVEIARLLNEQGVPSPSVYKTSNGFKNMWKNRIDPEHGFWTNGVVYKLLKNEVYLGKAIANKMRVTVPGTGRTAPRPKDEWIIVPNAHEPLVSEKDFAKAQLAVQKKKYPDHPAHIFGSKVRCPYCNHAMTRQTVQNPRFKCGTLKVTTHYGCREHVIFQSDLENIVLASVQKYVDVMVDDAEIKLTQAQKNKSAEKELERKIAEEKKTADLLESSVTKIYKDFSDGKITEEVFRHKKEIINETAARKRSMIEEWGKQLKGLADERDSAERVLGELKPIQAIEALNRDIVNLLIDKILVHNEKEIEIVWNGSGQDRPPVENGGHYGE